VAVTALTESVYSDEAIPPGPKCFLLIARQASKIIWNIRLRKSRTKTRSFVEVIITSNNEVFKEFVSDKGVEIGTLGIPTRETAKYDNTATQNPGS